MDDRHEVARLRAEGDQLRLQLESARKDAFVHAAVTLAARLSDAKALGVGGCPACRGEAARAFLAELQRAAGVDTGEKS